MNDETPKTLGENGAIPATRVGDVDSVLQRISEMRSDDKERSSRRAQQQGIIDGNKPFSVQKLDKQGKKNATNFNQREAEGMADTAKTPYFGLIFRTPRFTNILCRYGENDQQNIDWSEKISDRFHEMLAGWDEHDFNVQFKQWQMCVFGVGVIMHDEELPFWEAVKIGEVLVPDGVKANIDRLEECAIGPKKMSPVELWKKAANNKDWKKENVQKAIIDAAPVSFLGTYGDKWSEDYQASLRRGDVIWSGKTSQIGIDHYLVKEFDGKITHVTVLTDGKGDEALLYKKVGRYENFRQILLPFFFDIGTSEWHSVKGLGPKIHDFCHESNKLNCKLIDGAKRDAGLIMQANDANAARKSQIVEMSDGVVIPSDLTLIERKMQSNLQSIIAVKRDMQGTLQSNTGSYRQRVAGDNHEPTLGQAQLNYRQQDQLSDSATDRYMVTLDQLYREQLRKALVLGAKLSTFKSDTPDPLNPKRNSDPLKELVRAFFDGCLEDGVPKEALKFENVVSVRATRGIGNGSPVSMEIATRGLMDLYPLTDEEGKNFILRTRAAVLVGNAHVDSVAKPFSDAGIPNDHEWAADQEEANFAVGRRPRVTASQNNAIHAQIHLENGIQMGMAALQGQLDPMQAIQDFSTRGPHVIEHLSKMQGDPTRVDQLKMFAKGLEKMGAISDQLKQNMEEAAQAAAKEQADQPPPVDPALATGMAKVQGELEIKRAKAEGDMVLKADKQKAGQQLKGLEVADDLMRKRAVTMAEIIAPRSNGQ